MEITILFDKETRDKSLKIGWGFSVLIDGKTLFDTGEKGDYLLNNMEVLQIKVAQIESVVISHDHWDHTGGLWELLKRKSGIPVYGCPDFSSSFKEKVKMNGGEFIPVNTPTRLNKNISLTGEIIGVYKGAGIPEQAVVLNSENKTCVITGCSHPGIVEIVENVKNNFNLDKIDLVFGGFHLMNTQLREVEATALKLKDMGVQKIGPTHCTGYEAEDVFKKIFETNFFPVRVGQRFDF